MVQFPEGDQFREDRINEIGGRQMSRWKHPRKGHGFAQQPKRNTVPVIFVPLSRYAPNSSGLFWGHLNPLTKC